MKSIAFELEISVIIAIAVIVIMLVVIGYFMGWMGGYSLATKRHSKMIDDLMASNRAHRATELYNKLYRIK